MLSRQVPKVGSCAGEAVSFEVAVLLTPSVHHRSRHDEFESLGMDGWMDGWMDGLVLIQTCLHLQMRRTQQRVM